MRASVKEMVESLSADPWRQEVGFGEDIEDAHQTLFDVAAPESSKIEKLSAWIEKNQPCLFGRIAAKRGLLKFCIVDESLLTDSDSAIGDKIQADRTEWNRESFLGRKSGFVLAVLSRRIANALPDSDLMELARRLCALYLLEDIENDRVHTDEAFFEKPGPGRFTWKWPAGVNFFSSQGDKRWWQDHKIPGGLAFSVNSVGHMVKASMLAIAMEEVDRLMGGPEEGWVNSPVDSLEKALSLAMRTIGMAAETASGKATELLRLGTEVLPLACPIELPPMLRDKNYCTYAGYYDTDATLPSIYFRPDVLRPTDAPKLMLDFTYLFHRDVDNPHFTTMGKGRRIRADNDVFKTPSLEETTRIKARMGEPELVEIRTCERLVKAIGYRD